MLPLEKWEKEQKIRSNAGSILSLGIDYYGSVRIDNDDSTMTMMLFLLYYSSTTTTTTTILPLPTPSTSLKQHLLHGSRSLPVLAVVCCPLRCLRFFSFSRCVLSFSPFSHRDNPHCVCVCVLCKSQLTPGFSDCSLWAVYWQTKLKGISPHSYSFPSALVAARLTGVDSMAHSSTD